MIFKSRTNRRIIRCKEDRTQQIPAWLKWGIFYFRFYDSTNKKAGLIIINPAFLSSANILIQRRPAFAQQQPILIFGLPLYCGG